MFNKTMFMIIYFIYPGRSLGSAAVAYLVVVVVYDNPRKL